MISRRKMNRRKKNLIHQDKRTGKYQPKIILHLVVFAVLFVVLMGTALPLHSSDCALRGFVKEKGTNKPLENVTVTIASLKSSTVRFKLLTDENGYFTKTALLQGPYVISLDKEGYIPAQDNLRLQRARQYNLSMEMEKLNITAAAAHALNKHLTAAKQLMAEGAFDKAIAILNKAIETDAGGFILFYQRALAYEKKKETDRAVADYSKAMELKPDFILPPAALGKIYAKKGKYHKAITFYKKAYDLDTKDTIALYNYAACLVNLGKTDDARQVFKKIIALDPGYPDVYYQLGIIYLGSNKNDTAEEYLKTFIQLDPGNVNAENARELLDSLRKQK
jgi:tetratricopeptide (TPR) repeat protein